MATWFVLVTFACCPAVSMMASRNGSGGYALHFSMLRADTVSFMWESVPDSEEGVTVEYWVKTTDSMMRDMMVFGSGVSDTSVTPFYDSPYELTCFHSPGHLGMWREIESADVDADIAINEWTHFAFVNDYNNMSVAFYLDAEYQGTYFSETNTTFGVPLREFMLVHLGQEAIELGRVFDEAQSFDGALDELRVWNGIRTQEEIAENFRRQLVDPFPPELNLYFNFDQPGDKIVDMARQQGAFVGRLATPENLMSFNGGKTPQAPTKPWWVASRVPLAGAPLHVVMILPGKPSLFYVPCSAADPCTATLSQGPAVGEIRTSNGTLGGQGDVFASDHNLTFTPSTASNLGEVMSEYTRTVFTLQDASLLTVVFVWDEPRDEAPSLEVQMEEDTPTNVVLGGISRYGSNIPAQVTRLPEQGQLFQMVGDALQVLTNEALPVAIDNVRGIIEYVPPLDRYGTYFDSFEYQWILDDGSLLDGNVTISIDPINDAPVCETMVVTSDFDIQLRVTDVDQNADSRFYYSITEAPKLGSLIDVATSSPVPVMLNSKVFQYVEQVVDGSSQWTCCDDKEVCSRVDPGKCVEESSDSCDYLDYHAEQMVGAPDFFPEYGDTFLGWAPSYMRNEDWLVLKLKTPVYIEEIEIFEVYNPGGLVAISVAEDYTGKDTTAWKEIWASEGPKFVGFKSRNFVPPVCPIAVKAQYVLLDIDNSIAYGNLDAASFLGDTELAQGKLISDSVRYVPAPGMHSKNASQLFDTFTFVSDDCEDVCEGASVIVMHGMPASLSGADAFFSTLDLEVRVQNDRLHAVNLSLPVEQARADLQERKGMRVEAVSVITLESIIGEDGQETDAAVVDLLRFAQTESSPQTSLPFVASSSNTMWVSFPPGLRTVKVYATIETAGIVHRLQVSLQPECGNDFFDDAGMCMPCSSYNEFAMSEEQLRYFRAKCPSNIASTEEQRYFWVVSFFLIQCGAIATTVVLYAFSQTVNRQSNLVQRSFLAISIPDMVMCIVFLPFYAFNLWRGKETSSSGCIVVGFLTYGIIIATFAGPITVSVCTWLLVRKAIFKKKEPELFLPLALTLPWALGICLAGIAYAGGSLGSFRGLYCYTHDWSQGSAGLLTIVFLFLSVTTTTVFYVKTWRIVHDHATSLNTATSAVWKKGVKIVILQLLTWGIFASTGFISLFDLADIPIWLESVGALLVMCQPVIDSFQIYRVLSRIVARKQIQRNALQSPSTPRNTRSSKLQGLETESK